MTKSRLKKMLAGSAASVALFTGVGVAAAAPADAFWGPCVIPIICRL